MEILTESNQFSKKLASRISAVLRWQSRKRPFPRYQAKALQADHGLIVFDRLRAALPMCHVFPRITLSDLLEPAESNIKRNPEHFSSITTIRIDFAVYSDTMQLLSA